VASLLARREGPAMPALRSRDAEAGRPRFQAEGLGDFSRFDCARKARRPDGGEVDVARSLARLAGSSRAAWGRLLRPPASPSPGIFGAAPRRSIPTARTLFEAGGVAFGERAGSLVVGAGAATGAALRHRADRACPATSPPDVRVRLTEG
jgi:hypothetical protein